MTDLRELYYNYAPPPPSPLQLAAMIRDDDGGSVVIERDDDKDWQIYVIRELCAANNVKTLLIYCLLFVCLAQWSFIVRHAR